MMIRAMAVAARQTGLLLVPVGAAGPVPAICLLLTGLLAGAVLCYGSSARAADPEIITYLRQEPTSLLDSGLKRLRRAALEATRRMTAPADRPVTSRVWYNSETATIDIGFTITSSNDSISEQACWDARARVIRETLAIGRSGYRTKLSFAERLRRRLSLLFAHEPTGNLAETLKPESPFMRVGQRLATITMFEITFVTLDGKPIRSCRAPAMAPAPTSR